MAYVVTDACVRCKFTDCVAVCPVDCFHEGENMLVIDPEGCIDCGVCEPVCPADAILADTDPRAGKWLKMNKEYAARWPVITAQLAPPADAEAFKGLEGKFETHFSPEAASR
ncbi:ferredoxin FdxA [Mesorhizobium sp. ANAO-SY3R2]|uniref:ferredoxin FdxA n=1 Tax=Mesorhizobium sp. ANAO-SY3R2 TaxID=3166644 RepID=UPI00366B87BF